MFTSIDDNARQRLCRRFDLSIQLLLLCGSQMHLEHHVQVIVNMLNYNKLLIVSKNGWIVSIGMLVYCFVRKLCCYLIREALQGDAMLSVV